MSTNGQKDDLVHQVALSESFCAAQGWAYEVITDVGSGRNYQKRGLGQLIARICSGDLGRLVLSHKDRLSRFGAELIFRLCEHFSCEVVIINASEDFTFEEDLASDVIEIVTVFSARLDGSRSGKLQRSLQRPVELAVNDTESPAKSLGPCRLRACAAVRSSSHEPHHASCPLRAVRTP